MIRRKSKLIIETRRHLTETEKSETGCKPAEAEELYKILAESSLGAVFIVQDGKFRFINTSAIAYAGYTAEEAHRTGLRHPCPPGRQREGKEAVQGDAVRGAQRGV